MRFSYTPQWLGECLEQRLNILPLFSINPRYYYNGHSDNENNEDTETLRRDIKKEYINLIKKLHPDHTRTLPASIRESGEEFFKEITNYYNLLTCEEKYLSPDGKELFLIQNSRYISVKVVDLEKYVKYVKKEERTLALPLFGHFLPTFLQIRDDVEKTLSKLELEKTKMSESIDKTRGIFEDVLNDHLKRSLQKLESETTSFQTGYQKMLELCGLPPETSYNELLKTLQTNLSLIGKLKEDYSSLEQKYTTDTTRFVQEKTLLEQQLTAASTQLEAIATYLEGISY